MEILALGIWRLKKTMKIKKEIKLITDTCMLNNW